MQNEPDRTDDLVVTVPLFPLPDVVLFPRTVLPLHIFEERYKTMVASALAGERIIAMALLGKGWEKTYHCKPAINEFVCVGKILSCEKLADGKYNLLLQGFMRGQIIEEMPTSPYRVARVRPVAETEVLEIDLANQRQQLSQLFGSEPLASTAAGMQVRQILASPLSTADAADLIAFNFLDDIALKQSLLAEGNILRRVSRLIHGLELALPVLEAACRAGETDFSLN